MMFLWCIIYDIINYSKTDRTERRPSIEVTKINKIDMKLQIFTVHLYYGQHTRYETKQTPSIEEARRWVSGAAKGRIINNQNIYVQ
tara:strand:- start:527 stop:784 length:258 start_codon:yes stop_codon:yes gene_type:complete